MTIPSLRQNIVLCAQNLSTATQFLELLVNLSGESRQATARCYQAGLWCQFTGRDFVKHISHSVRAWETVFQDLNLSDEISISKSESSQSVRPPALLFFGSNNYSHFVSLLGAMCAGFQVILLPESVESEFCKPQEPNTRKSSAGISDISIIKWAFSEFSVVAAATHGTSELQLDIPVFRLEVGNWLPVNLDKNLTHKEFFALELFRFLQMPEEVQNMQICASQESLTDWKLAVEKWKKKSFGTLGFASYGSDGIQKAETLTLNEFLTTAQNFLNQLSFPKKETWKTMELIPMSHPFGLTSKFATLLRKGVLGFLNPTSSWETNFRILRPTLLFQGSRETQILHDHVEEMCQLPSFRSRKKLGDLVNKTRVWLEGGRALKLPESAFDGISYLVRMGARYVAGERLIKESLGDLKCVVHGLSGTDDEIIKPLEKFGLTIVETYGVTASCGLLSTNSFQGPHPHVIGSPLAHIQFRLGAYSLLEYRSTLKDSAVWQETGDMAQMTPFGYAITGRRKHLFVSQGGTTISPHQIEKLLKQSGIISEVCLVGDKRPFLAALIELSAEGASQYRENEVELESKIEEWIAKVNETLSRNSTIKKYCLLSSQFSVKNGERLSNGVLNRFQILISRKVEIDKMYSLHVDSDVKTSN